MSQHHFLAILDPRHAHTRALCIHAERHEEVAGAVRFYRGTRMVYGLPAAHIVELQPFEDQASARRACDAFLQRRAGAASFDVDEVAVATRRRRGGRVATGIPAEGVQAVVSGEMVVQRKRRGSTPGREG